jgi:dihydroxyacetone kinase-like predicted kinase
VREGEVIGLVNGKLAVKGDTPTDVAMEALATMDIEDLEIITIYYGESITADEAQRLADEFVNRYPDQEVEIVDGGQPHYHYILSAE